MNRVATLLRTELAVMSRFDHPEAAAHRDPEGEQAGTFGVSFVENGAFELSVGRACHQLATGDAFVTWPGLEFRCRHHEELPEDVCLTVDVSETLGHDVVATLGGAPGRSPVRRTTNRLAYLRLLLRDAPEAGAVFAETAAAEALAEALAPAGRAAARLFRPTQLAWYASRVRAAREKLEAEYAEPHSLDTLARDAGMSPFHFARVFRELSGTPPHAHLRRVRLAQAARRLAEGATVTEACYASGFANLSHFVRSFRRAYGVRPSAYRR
jgi:AraC-like DNA-binding protein